MKLKRKYGNFFYSIIQHNESRNYFRRRGDEREYFVKWKELPYDECSWEFESDISTFQPQIDRYNMIQSKTSKIFTRHRISNRTTKELKLKQKEFQQYEHSPTFLSGGAFLSTLFCDVWAFMACGFSLSSMSIFLYLFLVSRLTLMVYPNVFALLKAHCILINWRV